MVSLDSLVALFAHSLQKSDAQVLPAQCIEELFGSGYYKSGINGDTTWTYPVESYVKPYYVGDPSVDAILFEFSDDKLKRALLWINGYSSDSSFPVNYKFDPRK